MASTGTDTRRAGLKSEVLNWSLSRVQQGTPQCWCPGSPNQTQALLTWASLRPHSVAYDLTRCLQDFLQQKNVEDAARLPSTEGAPLYIQPGSAACVLPASEAALACLNVPAG